MLLHRKLLRVSLLAIISCGAFQNQTALLAAEQAKPPRQDDSKSLDLRALYNERLERQQQQQQQQDQPQPSARVRIVNGDIVRVNEVLAERRAAAASRTEAEAATLNPILATLRNFFSNLSSDCSWQEAAQATEQAYASYTELGKTLAASERATLEEALAESAIEALRTVLNSASERQHDDIDPRTDEHPGASLFATLAKLDSEPARTLVASSRALLFAEYMAQQACDRKLDLNDFTASLNWLSESIPVMPPDAEESLLLADLRQALRASMLVIISETSESLPPLEFGSEQQLLQKSTIELSLLELSERLGLEIPFEIDMDVDGDDDLAWEIYEQDLMAAIARGE